MTVSYNRNLGVWNVNGRGAYATEEEAKAADTAAAAPVTSVDDDDFASSFDAPSRVLGPERTTSTVTTPAQAAEKQRLFEEANKMYQQGYSDLNGDGTINAEDQRLSGTAYGTLVAQGGTATHYQTQQEAIGTRNMRTGRLNASPVTSVNVVAPGISGGFADSLTSDQRYQQAAEATENAGAQFQNQQEENAADNENLFTDAMSRYDALGGGQYGQSDEARSYQQEGLAQQRMLLEKILGFDEEQYAAQFGDQTLSRMIAAGRQGTSAAEQQAGRFAALEQAPAVYGEGRRQASELANQRLSMAQTAAKSFGELGTMTRGQDETRAQFEAQLPLEIADSVATMTQGKMNLNQQESQMFAEIWMDFAQLQSIYAGMSSDEQIAWWQNETSRRGQDKQFDAIMAEIKANGAVTSKDIVNGLFQLGGGLLGIAGRSGAA